MRFATRFATLGLAPARIRSLLATGLVFAAMTIASALHKPPAHAATVEPLTIETRSGPVAFKVEMALTPEERSKGLMYRTELAPDAGMLFDFRTDQQVYMWMKNTYIPLDMVFIRSDGRIARIAADTTPLSTETISSGGAVRAVLELSAGTAKARGIAVGDRVRHHLFANE